MTANRSDVPDEIEDVEYVEFCLANVSAERRDAIEAADFQSRGTSCLDRCGRCYRTNFVLVDGSPVTGAACDQFLELFVEERSE